MTPSEPAPQPTRHLLDVHSIGAHGHDHGVERLAQHIQLAPVETVAARECALEGVIALPTEDVLRRRAPKGYRELREVAALV